MASNPLGANPKIEKERPNAIIGRNVSSLDEMELYVCMKSAKKGNKYNKYPGRDSDSTQAGNQKTK
jgi:hypothetical protein